MTANIASLEDSADREIVITRVVEAPRDLVWRLWTEPMHVARWWGPRGFTTSILRMDVRPGGEWSQVMHGPDGTDYPSTSVFQEVVKPERIVFLHGGHKEGGPSSDFISTWTFDPVGYAQTRVTIRMRFATAAERDRVEKQFGAVEGGRQTLERLAEVADQAKREGEASTSEREVVITRDFDAPRELVFRIWTEAAHVREWWAPKGFTNPVCELDVRVGGAWRIVMRAPDGTEYPCGGVYSEVERPARLVFTNDAVDKEGSVILKGLTSVTFDEDGPGTRMTLRTRAEAVASYARAFLTGMETGWSQSIDRLAAEIAATRSA